MEVDKERVLELGGALTQLSKELHPYFPEGQSWHVVKPRFGRPRVVLWEWDISNQLSDMGSQTDDLLVNLYSVSGSYDGGYYLPAYFVWQISPPRGCSLVGEFRTSCFGARNLRGLGMNLFCPQDMSRVNRKNLHRLLADGTLNVDLLFWFKEGESWYDRTKPEGVMLDMVKKDPAASLGLAAWFLEGLRRAQDVHQEDWELQI